MVGTALDELANDPDGVGVEGFLAAQDLAQQPKPPTKREIREAARLAREWAKQAERERKERTELEERQRAVALERQKRDRIEHQRFMDRAVREGQRALSAARKRAGDMGRAGTDRDVFSRDF